MMTGFAVAIQQAALCEGSQAQHLPSGGQQASLSPDLRTVQPWTARVESSRPLLCNKCPCDGWAALVPT